MLHANFTALSSIEPGDGALDNDRTILNRRIIDRQALEQKAAVAMVARYLRNAPSNVAEKLDSGLQRY